MPRPTSARFQEALLQALDAYLQDPSSLGLTSDLAILARAHLALPVRADMGGTLLMRASRGRSFLSIQIRNGRLRQSTGTIPGYWFAFPLLILARCLSWSSARGGWWRRNRWWRSTTARTEEFEFVRNWSSA